VGQGHCRLPLGVVTLRVSVTVQLDPMTCDRSPTQSVRPKSRSDRARVRLENHKQLVIGDDTLLSSKCCPNIMLGNPDGRACRP